MTTDKDQAGDAGEGPQAQGIQTDKPPAIWEQPGCFRLSCEPHRAGLLEWSAIVLVLLFLLAPVTCGLSLLIAYPWSLVTWLSARRDLALMQKGRMDPAGDERTRQVRTAAFVFFSVCVIFCCFAFCLLLP